MLISLFPDWQDTEDRSEEEDEDYWNQYDVVTGQATAGRSSILPKEVLSLEKTPDSNEEEHYRKYNNVETTIGDANLMYDNAELKAADPLSGIVGTADPVNLNEAKVILDDYIRNTVHNLSQFALGSGMSKARLAELIAEGLNI